MGAFSHSSHHGDGSRAWDSLGPAPAFVLAHPDRRDRHDGERPRLVDTSVGVAPVGSASCSPTRKRRSLGGGATEMLGRVIVYAYVVLFAASLLLEQPIPMAIGP
jgi:hypothetical protein